MSIIYMTYSSVCNNFGYFTFIDSVIVIVVVVVIVVVDDDGVDGDEVDTV
jgi:hypothetical protein